MKKLLKTRRISAIAGYHALNQIWLFLASLLGLFRQNHIVIAQIVADLRQNFLGGKPVKSLGASA